MIVNTTLDAFIKTFEDRFKTLLLSPPRGEDITYTSYFKIYDDRPKQKWSDWDVKTFTNSEKISADNLNEFDNFMRHYAGMADVGLFMGFSESYLNIHQHAKHAYWLQYMGFMKHEKTSPFLDLWIVGPFHEETIAKAFPVGSDNEMLKWAAVTAWRKIKNNDLRGARDIFEIYLNPTFQNQEDSFIAEPKVFIQKHFKDGFSHELIDFMTN